MIRAFQKPQDRRPGRQRRRAAEARQLPPDGNESGGATFEPAIGMAGMKALQGSFAGQAAARLGIGTADVVPGDPAVTVELAVERNLPPTQRAGPVVVDRQSGQLGGIAVHTLDIELRRR